MAGEIETFQPTLLERLSRAGTFIRELHGIVDAPAIENAGVSVSQFLRTLRYFGFRSNEGAVRLGGDLRVIFEVFPEKLTVPELAAQRVQLGARSEDTVPLGDVLELEIREGARRVSGGALSSEQVRRSIIRDLHVLLETTSLDAAVDLEGFPEVRTSVLNFGVRGVFGMIASRQDGGELGDYLTEVVQNYEPRIDASTLRIGCDLDDMSYDSSAVTFEIEGDFWGQPLPEHLRVITNFELDTQRFADPQVTSVR